MAEKNFKYIIIGAGLAGASAVEGIRQLDEGSSILLIGKETELPYHRPPLSKQLWFGRKKLEQIIVHDRAWYEQNHVDLALASEVTGVNPRDHIVADSRGNRYRYEKLILATGGTPRLLGIPGGDLPDICYYRTVDDYQRIRQQAGPGKSAVVIGGGFIGSELAAALCHMGVQVTMLFPDRSLCHKILPEEVSHAITEQYRRKGIRIHDGDVPAEIQKRDGKFTTQTRHGRKIESDMIIAGIGIVPGMKLASQAGLKTGNGIIVNAHLQTSEPDIYAAGDNALFPYQALGREARIEHWDNAIEQGHCAGRNMAGAAEAYTHMPYFFSDLFDFGYEAVGELSSRLETFADWRRENDTGVIYYLAHGRLRGVMLCNVWGKVDEARALIREDRTWTPAELRGAIRDEAWAKEERISLARDHSQPVRAGMPPLPADEAQKLVQEVPNWELHGSAIERDFNFQDFDQAMGFVNRVAEVAKQEDHHPDIAVSYNKVHLALSTHKIGGLTKNDFIVAAKINQLAQ